MKADSSVAAVATDRSVGAKRCLSNPGSLRMTNVLDRAATHAASFLASLSTRPIAATASIADLQRRLAKPLPEAGMAAEAVIDELVRDAEGGLMGSGSGRFFG